MKELYGEAFSFFFQFYADTSQLWHTIDPSHISSIDSDEGFQQGDPASTALYCIGIQPFLKQLQQFLLTQGPALPLFFVDDGTIIGPHALVLSAIHFINQHGPRVGYRLNTAKGRLLLGSCDSVQTAQRHHQDYLDLGFHPAVLHMHPSNSSEPSAAASYGCKVLGSYVGSDEFILHFLELHLTHLNDLADRLINSFSDYHQHLLTLLRHCFLTKPSHLFRTIPPRLTLSFAQRVNSIGHRVFCSMTSHLHSTLSELQCHQLHLHVSDGGFSLPDMLLVRECAFPASFAQCIHDVTDILTLLRPLTIDDILCASRYNHDPTNIPPPIASFLHHPNPIFIAFFDAVAVLTVYDPALTVQSLLVTQRTDSKLQHSLYNCCYQHSLTTFKHSLQQLNDPAHLAHYYTSIDDDSGIWARLNARIGYYSMTNAIFQTAILHRLYLSQPLIPAGMTCTCTGHPTIDTVGRHLFTGCPKHGSRQDIHSTMTGAFKICADHAFARTICEDRHILRSANEDEGRRPDLTILNAPHQNGRPLLLDISIVQAFQGSRNPTLPPPRRPPDYYPTLSQHPQRRTSAVAYTSKINKYQDVCTANGVSFLPIIIESNGYIHPQARQFLQDLAKQAAFYRHIPWHNLYLFYLSLISVSLQSALYRSLLTHITALHHPPPLSITLTDADIASAHLHS